MYIGTSLVFRLLVSGVGCVPLVAHAQETLTVYAAASLSEAFTVLGAEFEARHPGTSVRFNFAGSQVLATQIEHGARADVFASADRRWMTFLEQRSLAETPAVFARNQLVVVMPRANPGRITRLADLARPGLKLVLAGTEVPAGAYSREALRQLAGSPGFPADFDRRVLANVVSEEENVRAVAAKVQLGEADAGMVYQSDIVPASASRIRLLPLPACCSPLAEYPIAAVRSGRSELARAFIALVLSDAGQQVLAGRGFQRVPDPLR